MREQTFLVLILLALIADAMTVEAEPARSIRDIFQHRNRGERQVDDESPDSLLAGNGPVNDRPQPMATNELSGRPKLHIVRLFQSPESAQNGTQNVTIDCMFKFDRKLDQRLTIKWFFNDELEPIYQWIPELNKRVYSDRYERFLDKSYQVSEDLDFMLQAYRSLLAESSGGGGSSKPTADEPPAEENSSREREDQPDNGEPTATDRRTLAAKLHRLARLGGRQSSQLLEQLRSALEMSGQLEWARFRALRLIRPSAELGGRFTCSVSSLDGDDLRSTRLVVYEPAKQFDFTVSRLSSQLYNLTCSASQLYPRPTLSLFRYRAGPPTGELRHLALQQPPKLQAATMLRQELLAAGQSQVNLRHRNRAGSEDTTTTTGNNNEQQVSYDISTWALIDEQSLSSNLVSQFECQLAIEGTNYEQRQSLGLQRGWHVNAVAPQHGSRSTLLGLFSALASLLCLLLALVSSMLIFRLLKRHANSRVHQEKVESSAADLGAAPSPSDGAGRSDSSTGSSALEAACPPPNRRTTLTDMLEPPAATDHKLDLATSDGIYRVPGEPANTRYVIGGQPTLAVAAAARAASQMRANRRQQVTGSSFSPNLQLGNHNQTGGIRPLYC